jgi:hypothetical protein
MCSFCDRCRRVLAKYAQTCSSMALLSSSQAPACSTWPGGGVHHRRGCPPMHRWRCIAGLAGAHPDGWSSVPIRPARTVTMIAAGDVLLHPSLWRQAAADAAAGATGYDLNPIFAAVALDIAAADVPWKCRRLSRP